MTTPGRCVRNVVVFDPDVIYAFTSPIIEIDHLCRCDLGSEDEFCRATGAQGYVIIEDVSDSKELHVKTAKRALLTLAKVPSTIWRISKGRGSSKEEGYGLELSVRSLDVMLFGELINAAFYWQLFMPDEVGGFNAIENIYETLREILGSGVKDGDIDSYELLNLLIKESDSICSQAAAFVRKGLDNLNGLCKTDMWAILIQKGVEEYRFGSICRSVEMLKKLCVSALKSSGKPGGYVYYILSSEALNFLERRAREKRGSEPRGGDVLDALISKCEPKPSRINYPRDKLPQSEGSYLVVISDSNARADDVLRRINEVFGAPAVFVFGDYDKDVLEAVVQNDLASWLAVVNEAFYGVTTGAKYVMGAYYGYLQGIDAIRWRRGEVMRNEEEGKCLRRIIGGLSEKVCQEPGEDTRNECLYKVLTLLLKLITVVSTRVQSAQV